MYKLADNSALINIVKTEGAYCSLSFEYKLGFTVSDSVSFYVVISDDDEPKHKCGALFYLSILWALYGIKIVCLLCDLLI